MPEEVRQGVTFQYFFFDTYPGYFLEALPVALAVTYVCHLVRFRRGRAAPAAQRVKSCLFVCYLSGLICLVALLSPMQRLWYLLLYHRDGGPSIRLFGGSFNFIPDFLSHIDREVVGNVLAFLPFGLLYPPAHPTAGFRKTVLAGLALDVGIEVLQPVFGRAFDVNDIILNMSAIVLSAAVYFACVRLASGRKP